MTPATREAVERMKQCAAGNSSYPWVELSPQEAAAVLAEVEGLRRDAERLDYLWERSAERLPMAMLMSGWYYATLEILRNGGSLREAIDHEMRKRAALAPSRVEQA